MKKAERNATVQAAKSAAETGTLAKGTARGAILTALDRLDKAAKAARAAGEIATYRDIRREMLVTKWSLRQRSADHDAAALRKQTFGFGTPLFSSTTTHGLAADDPDIGFGPAPRR